MNERTLRRVRGRNAVSSTYANPNERRRLLRFIQVRPILEWRCLVEVETADEYWLEVIRTASSVIRVNQIDLRDVKKYVDKFGLSLRFDDPDNFFIFMYFKSISRDFDFPICSKYAETLLKRQGWLAIYRYVSANLGVRARATDNPFNRMLCHAVILGEPESEDFRLNDCFNCHEFEIHDGKLPCNNRQCYRAKSKQYKIKRGDANFSGFLKSLQKRMSDLVCSSSAKPYAPWRNSHKHGLRGTVSYVSNPSREVKSSSCGFAHV